MQNWGVKFIDQHAPNQQRVPIYCVTPPDEAASGSESQPRTAEGEGQQPGVMVALGKFPRRGVILFLSTGSVAAVHADDVAKERFREFMAKIQVFNQQFKKKKAEASDPRSIDLRESDFYKYLFKSLKPASVAQLRAMGAI